MNIEPRPAAKPKAKKTRAAKKAAKETILIVGAGRLDFVAALIKGSKGDHLLVRRKRADKEPFFSGTIIEAVPVKANSMNQANQAAFNYFKEKKEQAKKIIHSTISAL